MKSKRSKEQLRVSLSAEIWSRIVLAAQESEDWKLKTLIEQAVAAAKLDVLSIPSPKEPTFDFRTEDYSERKSELDVPAAELGWDGATTREERERGV